MAKLAQFSTEESSVVHRDHMCLLEEIGEFEQSLLGLLSEPEVVADLVSTHEVYRCGRHILQVLPVHIRFEEKTFLADLENRGPELKAFAREMKRQHQLLEPRLARLGKLLEELESAADMERAIAELKEEGLSFVRDVKFHMRAEERKLSLYNA